MVEDSFVLDIKLNLSIHHLSKEICWLKYLHGNPAVKEVSFWIELTILLAHFVCFRWILRSMMFRKQVVSNYSIINLSSPITCLMVCVCPYLQAIDTTPKLHSYTGNKRRSFKLFLVTYCLSVAESVIVLTDVEYKIIIHL